MRRAILALTLAVAVTGCSTTMSFKGSYRPGNSSSDFDSEPPVLATDSHVSIGWGLIRVGRDLDVDREIGLRRDEAINNLQIEEHPTFLGAILWFVTSGFVEETEVVVRGNRVTLPHPADSRDPD